jgi:4-hydroxy-tetrahydrodipicolinate synthase
MKKHKFSGTGVAVITPFKHDKSIDFDSLATLIDHLIDKGVSYLVALGTTAESVTQTTEEKINIISFFKKRNNSRVPLLVGIGGNNTLQIVNTIQETDFAGIDGILSVAPFYNKPTQEGIYQHFKTISNACPVDIVLYNVPGRTSVNITADTSLRLARDFANIVAIKEASGDFDQFTKIAKEKPEGFAVISGDDNLSVPQLAAGLDGIISVAANAFTKPFSSMIEAALDGDFSKARQIHFDLFDLYTSLFIEGNPAGVKAALNILGIVENELRLPLVPVSSEIYELIEDQIRKLSKKYTLI